MIQHIKLAAYISEYGEHWADELPENCPPEDVCVTNEDVFYRLVKYEDHIEPSDWQNYLTLFPHRKYSPEDRIFAAGLSMFDNQGAAEKRKNLPIMKRLGLNSLAKISLCPEDGVILQTYKDRSHYTWWRTTMCDLEKAELL